ncbi:MAG TPA: DUF4157 domain-containing protein, partial [Polyangia bacterium]|nr:DUF4157 domain-containing protein [Polyangia bacterium]
PGAAAPGVAAAPPRIARRTDDTPTPPDEGSALGAAVGPTATPAPGAAPAASPAPAATPATDAMPASVAGAGGGLIVEDDAAALTAGQMRKSAFLAELRAEACAAADRELARAGRDTRGCPQVERLITMYAGRPAAHLERAVRKYAPGASAASAARAYIPVVAMRIAHGVATFVQTGRLPDDIPPDLQAEAAGSLGGGIGRAIGGFFSSVAGAIGGAFSAVGKLLFKGAPGGARSGVDEGALAARLGAGRPLEGGTRHRMESAFGRSFDRVRVHDDAAAAGMSRDLNARAFTLGQHVAFSDGDYRPGTPVGDAILAHELAHVGQQGDGVAPSARGGDAAPFEHDAERAAGDAVAFLYGGGGRPRASIGAAGGLGLRRCAATDGPFHSMSLNAYIARWEKEHHQTMSDEQKNILTRGCIGITALNLNEGNVMPPLDMAFSTFEQARAVAASLNDILKSRPAVDKLADAVNGDPTLKNLKNVLSSFPMDPDPDVWKAVIFSKRFYSNQKGSDEERADPDKKAFRPDKQGQVDMSGYNYETRPGGPYTNYDYGWYDETTNTWWHANHCQPFTDTAGGEHHQDCKPGMKVYQSSLEHYSRPLSDFDRQVFVVAFARKLQ